VGGMGRILKLDSAIWSESKQKWEACERETKAISFEMEK